jgi:hypothetical protein
MIRRAHPLPLMLLREVDEVISSIRARQPRRLHVDALAHRLGVRLSRHHLGGSLLGLTLDDRRVLLHSRLRGSLLSLVFAHELAHVLRRRGYFQSLASSDEEWFADCFARELVLPRRWLTGCWPRTQLGSLHVGIETVALQMSVIGMAPALMRSGRRILCRTCGADAHLWGCRCRSWRGGNRDPHELPEVRDLDLLFTPRRWREAWLPIEGLAFTQDLEPLTISEAAIEAHRSEDSPGEPITDAATLDGLFRTSAVC